jgi:branched-chain amino acid transport system permease protein
MSGAAMNAGAMRTRALALALAVLALLPFASHSQFFVNLAMLTAISAALGQAWNIAGGFGGLTSFGHAAFFGLGAYADAILQTRYGLNPWLGLPAAAVLGGGVGWLIGVATFRAGLRGSYFALVTLAFAEAFGILANSLDITGGGSGILVALHPGFAHFQFADRRAGYALAIALLTLATLAAWRLSVGRFGAQLLAVRENEEAARALGVRAVRVKSAALALSGALTALGGVLYVQSYLYVDPGIAFSAERSVEMLLVAMIGGAGTVLGPLLGALVVHVIADTSRSLIATPGVAPMLYGIVLLLIIGLLPGGVARLAMARGDG